MSLDVQIKVDAPNAISTANAVEAALAGVENQGIEVGKALAKSFGDGSTSAEQAKRAAATFTEQMLKLTGASSAFSGLDEQFRREAEMLERIRGPAKEYEASLRALDGLLMKQQITTDEYATRVTRMNQALEMSSGRTRELSVELGGLATAGKSFSGISEYFKRQADVLDRIRGPVREYEADLRVLDDLLDRNTISTKEYASEVTNLNRRLNERPTEAAKPVEREGVHVEGNLGQAVAGQFGELGSMFNKLSASGALEAAALVGITVEVMRLGGEYIQLSNKAQKFVDSSHDVNTVLNDQYALSQQIHSGLDATLEIYDAVRDGTDELNLSYGEQIRLTKSIAEGVQLSGKSIEQAGGLMSRLSYAFSSGTLSGRELKGMMREFPDIADVWTKSLGHTRAELVAMADKGTLSARQLMDAFIEAGPALDEKFGKRVETVGQQWQHFKDGLVLTIGKLVESSGVLTALGSVFGTLGSAVTAITTVLGFFVGILQKIGEYNPEAKLIAMGAAAYKLTGPYGLAAVAVGGLYDAMGQLVRAMDMVTEVRIRMNLALADALQKYDKEMKAVSDMADAIQRDIDAHNDLFDAITKVAKALADGDKIWNDSIDKSVAATDKVNAYAAAVHKIQAEQAALQAAGMHDPTKALTQGQIDIIRGYSDAQRDLNDSMSRGGGVLNDIHKREDERRRGLEDLHTLLKNHKITQAEYTEELKKYQGTLSFEAQLLQEIDGPQKKFDQTMTALNDLFVTGRISIDQYRDAVEKAVDALSKMPDRPGSVVNGLGPAVGQAAAVTNVPTPSTPLTPYQAKQRDYVDDVVKQYKERQAQSLTTDFKKQLDDYEASTKETQQRIVETFKPVVDGLVNMFETGQLNISAIGSQMEKILTELAVKFLLFEALTGAGASKGVVKGLTGFANGGDTTIPHAANGFTGRVAGGAGIDTKLAMLWVSPGEQVSVRTPEQVAAQRGAQGGGGGVTIVNQHDTRGELASAFSSGAMDTHVMNVMKRNVGAVQSLIKK